MTKFLLLIAIIFAAGIGLESSAQTVTGSVGTATRGKAVSGTVVINIPDGLHVNSNRPNSEYAIPTTVRLTAPGARVGAVRYPRGRNRKFQFSESTINVYEGRVAIPFTVTVPANYRGNTVRVRAAVRYQACTDEVCYPPKTADITMTARVR